MLSTHKLVWIRVFSLSQFEFIKYYFCLSSEECLNSNSITEWALRLDFFLILLSLTSSPHLFIERSTECHTINGLAVALRSNRMYRWDNANRYIKIINPVFLSLANNEIPGDQNQIEINQQKNNRRRRRRLGHILCGCEWIWFAGIISRVCSPVCFIALSAIFIHFFVKIVVLLCAQLKIKKICFAIVTKRPPRHALNPHENTHTHAQWFEVAKWELLFECRDVVHSNVTNKKQSKIIVLNVLTMVWRQPTQNADSTKQQKKS